MAKIDSLFTTMLEAGASDLHLVAGQKPVLRIHGELERLESLGVLANDELSTVLDEIVPSNTKDDFEKTRDVHFGYELPGMARFRANSFQQKYGCAAVFRQIPAKLISAEELALPSILTRAAMLHRGV